ncbi:MAG: hypothetical protein R2710_23315 [Acidimicrobiales bacterium]
MPDGSDVGGGIGCHGDVRLYPGRHVHGVTQMGGEGAQWVGMSPFVDDTTASKHRRRHLAPLRFVGPPAGRLRRDHHHLQDPLQRTVAMTGGQDDGRHDRAGL